jgi:hypothetical protein
MYELITVSNKGALFHSNNLAYFKAEGTTEKETQIKIPPKSIYIKA